jgi:hypothetical protein
MKKSHYPDSQIISSLKQAEADTPATELCRTCLWGQAMNLEFKFLRSGVSHYENSQFTT